MLFDFPRIERPSSSALRSLIDTMSAVFDSLLTIGDEKCITNSILVHLVMTKVDYVTKKKWEESLNQKLPMWVDCEEALNRRYQHMVAKESSNSKSKNDFKQNKGNRNVLSHFGAKSLLKLINAYFAQVMNINIKLDIFFSFAFEWKVKVCQI